VARHYLGVLTATADQPEAALDYWQTARTEGLNSRQKDMMVLTATTGQADVFPITPNFVSVETSALSQPVWAHFDGKDQPHCFASISRPGQTQTGQLRVYSHAAISVTPVWPVATLIVNLSNSVLVSQWANT
jgi:hypothetical protein